MTGSIQDLKEGDLAYVLNGRQNNALRAKVTRVDDEGVEVYLDAKDETQWFWKSTGTADVEIDPDEPVVRSMLVHPEDWRVKIISQRKLFKAHSVAVQKAASEFGREPSRENGARLMTATASWRTFAENSDPFAIRADSIEDYKRLTNQI